MYLEWADVQDVQDVQDAICRWPFVFSLFEVSGIEMPDVHDRSLKRHIAKITIYLIRIANPIIKGRFIIKSQFSPNET